MRKFLLLVILFVFIYFGCVNKEKDNIDNKEIIPPPIIEVKEKFNTKEIYHYHEISWDLVKEYPEYMYNVYYFTTEIGDVSSSIKKSYKKNL
jgi:hypothetical protein